MLLLITPCLSQFCAMSVTWKHQSISGLEGIGLHRWSSSLIIPEGPNLARYFVFIRKGWDSFASFTIATDCTDVQPNLQKPQPDRGRTFLSERKTAGLQLYCVSFRRRLPATSSPTLQCALFFFFINAQFYCQPLQHLSVRWPRDWCRLRVENLLQWESPQRSFQSGRRPEPAAQRRRPDHHDQQGGVVLCNWNCSLQTF